MSQSTLPAEGATRASAIATEHASLNMHRLSLLGVSGPEDDRRALLRLPDGDTALVRIGDRIGKAEVRAIEADSVTLVDGARPDVIALP